MRQEQLASEKALRTYLPVLSSAILHLRARIRYGEDISLDEVHDLMDAIHNIPEMLCAYGGWHVESNIDRDLRRYDDKWYRLDDDSLRRPLLKALSDAKREFDAPKPQQGSAPDASPRRSF